MKKFLPVSLACLLMISTIAVHPQEKRVITLDDLALIKEVGSPRISPDGNWVVYTVSSHDMKEDKKTSDLWMTSWDGSRSARLTHTKESESAPRWSPDGRYLAFLSSRTVENETDQLWLMNRAGGEAERVTDLKGGMTDYVFSPDGKQIALVVKDPDPEAQDEKSKEKKTPKPIVIDRFQFKVDEEGYLGKLRKHIYLFDIATRKAEILTPGPFDEMLPAWSPDSSKIAFVSKRGADPDRHDNYDIFIIEARPGAEARQLTTYTGADCDPTWESYPVWSPDGKHIAYIRGGDPKLIYYAVYQLAVIRADGGEERLIAPAMDRNITKPRWAGESIYFLLESDRVIHLARIPSSGGQVERVIEGKREVTDFDLGAGGKIAAVFASPHAPAEVYAMDGKEPRMISNQNAELMSKLKLSAVEEISFRSKDGTVINGFVVRPVDYQPGKKYPTILRIHGGPVWQFYNNFHFDWQLYAARGYAVVAANPRGSSGRGEAFAKAIYADWGNKDADDVLAAIDYVTSQGIADADRLGIGGWSYGGILTNYVIARDRRFKAAVSGSGISNVLAGYGTDMYIREYEAELGTPWGNTDLWLKLSHPFLKADRIKTPTLFLCGEKDFNVPLVNSEQMYQALRSLGVDTQLVIYPGEYHEIAKPGYLRDRLERYLAWYDKYLKADSAIKSAQ
ncbi:MAG: S9 family peptidase [Acidobacteriota bacterium]